MKSFGDQLTLFNPITFQGDNNWGYQTYSQGDRVYGTNSLRLGTVIEATPKAIKVLKDNGETEIVECHHISKVKLSGFGFKTGDRVRLSKEVREYFNDFPFYVEGTIKEFFGNVVSVNWDECDIGKIPDEITFMIFPDWIEKV